MFPTSRVKEIVVWTYLSDAQMNIYQTYVNSEDVQQVLMSNKHPVLELSTLKKLCDHPQLIADYYSARLGNMNAADMLKNLDMPISDLSPETIVETSGKMQLLLKLCTNLRCQGHRTLVLSRSKDILHMIQRILASNSFRTIRIDAGSILESERQTVMEIFGSDCTIEVCLLLAVQAGSVGLPVTGADHIIIYDSSLNVHNDTLTADFGYQFRQKETPLVIYQLITCGTVEEYMYRRKVFKTTAFDRHSDTFRCFTRRQIMKIFQFHDPYNSETQQVNAIHGHFDASELKADFDFLHSLSMQYFAFSFASYILTGRRTRCRRTRGPRTRGRRT